jgi:hypothetical protein
MALTATAMAATTRKIQTGIIKYAGGARRQVLWLCGKE